MISYGKTNHKKWSDNINIMQVDFRTRNIPKDKEDIY